MVRALDYRNLDRKSDTLVILNQSAGYLQIDILRVLERKYRNRAIIAGEIRIRNRELPSSVKWHRVQKYNRTSFFSRTLSWIICSLQMLFIILRQYRHAHLLITSNPPIATFLPLLVRNSFTILVYDIYPDSLLQILSNPTSLIIRLWSRLNRLVFKKANRIITISDGMKKRLSNYADSDRIEVIPIWSDNQFLKPIPKEDNPFIKENNLQGKFIVMYSGNIGYSHPVEVIMELASMIKQENVIFLVVGEGERKKSLKAMALKYQLRNVVFLPFQDAKNLSYSLSSADLAIVTLSRGSSESSVPSKTYSLLSVGAALLCIAETNSELAGLVRKYRNGMCFEMQQVKEMKQFIESLIDDRDQLLVLKENSIKASGDFDVGNARQFL